MKEIEVPLGESHGSFDMEKEVCNHEMFMMAPNKWIPSSKTLQCPLPLSDSKTCVTVSISHPPNQTYLLIQLHYSNSYPHLSLLDQKVLIQQVIRMLRITQIDEDNLTNFQNSHPKAKQIGFGQLFLSHTLFEDAIKSILLCNALWSKTLKMAQKLCELQAKIAEENCKKRKKNVIKSRRRKKRSASNEDDKCAPFQCLALLVGA